MNTTHYAADSANANGAHAHDEQPMLGDMLRIARDNLAWIVAITAGCVAAATAYALIATPIYEASAIVRIRQASPAPGSAPTVTDALLGHSSLSDAEIQLMKSRSVLAPVVARFHLDIDARPERMPFVGGIANALATPGTPSRPWFGFDTYGWGGERIDVSTLTVPPALEEQKLQLVSLGNERYTLSTHEGTLLVTGVVGQLVSANGISIRIDSLVANPGTRFSVVRANEVNAIDRLAHSLQIAEQAKDTGVVQISYDNANPTMATDVTNAVVQSASEQNVARHRDEANAMLSFLSAELPRLRLRVQDADRALSDYQSASGTIQSTQEAQIYLQGSVEFQKQIAYLTIQRTQLLQRFEADSPEIRAVDAQIRELSNTQHSFDKRFDKMPVAERRTTDLTRDAKVAQDIYLALVNRMQALSVERGGTVGDVSIVDQAWRPSSPIKPKRALIVAGAFVLGLVLSALTLLTRRRLLSGVDDPKLLERKLHLPMFGNVFFSQAQLGIETRAALAAPKPITPVTAITRAGASPSSGHTKGLLRPAGGASSGALEHHGRNVSQSRANTPRTAPLAIAAPNDLSVETLRNLRAELQFALTDVTRKVVMMTSPAAATGKSFIAANLAILLAETGLDVLLIDADLRRGRLAKAFDMDDEGPGLADVLAGRLSVYDAVRLTATNGLSLITAGTRPADPSALLGGPRLDTVLREAGERFDAVVVDAPPALGISDAALIGRCATLSILVLRAGEHSETEINETLEKLERAGGRVLGGVFNAVPERRRDRERYAYSNDAKNRSDGSDSSDGGDGKGWKNRAGARANDYIKRPFNQFVGEHLKTRGNQLMATMIATFREKVLNQSADKKDKSSAANKPSKVRA